jgi:hypothetical protein
VVFVSTRDAPNSNKIESEWDARQKFFNRWEMTEEKIGYLIETEQYEQALDTLLLFISIIPSQVLKKKFDFTAMSSGMMRLINQYQQHRAYDMTEFNAQKHVIRRKILLHFLEIKSEITDILQSSKLLLPLKENDFDENDPEKLLVFYDKSR